MKIRYSPQARDDLPDIFNYLNERSPSGTENVMRAIYASIQFLAENPTASQEADHPDVRVKIVRRYNFRIFYRLDRDTIDLIHIRHTARRPYGP
jgi:plasmid stabilization system protein ParE